eukprot:gene6761-54478_t
MAQAMDGIAHIHSYNVGHYDLKPPNILVRDTSGPDS